MSVVTGGAPPQGIKRYQLESGLDRMTPAERAARGKEARAAVPRDSHAVFDPGPGRPGPGRPAGGAGDHARCGARADPLRTHDGLAVYVLSWRCAAHGRRPGAHPGLGVAGAGVRGRAPVQLRRGSRHRSCELFSTSTTSTRRCPARGSGMSSGWPPAWRWRPAATGSAARTAARSSRPPSPATGRRCASFAEMTNLDVWYAHADVRPAAGGVRLAAEAAAAQAGGQGRWPRRGPGTACRKWPS